MRIFLDMDDVLVDFKGGWCNFNGRKRDCPETQEHWRVWSAGGDTSRFSQEFFFNGIDGNEDFWTGLEPLPWMEDLVSLVDQVSPDWHVITSPGPCDTTYSGKVKWLKRYFGNFFDRFCITPHKYLFAQPGTLLIDDRESNVRGFITHEGKLTGGQALVFPRDYNCLHRWAHAPLTLLRTLLTGT